MTHEIAVVIANLVLFLIILAEIWVIRSMIKDIRRNKNSYTVTITFDNVKFLDDDGKGRSENRLVAELTTKPATRTIIPA